jgi:signal transduction histidine kinase
MAIEDLRVRAAELADAYEKLAEQELARREFLSNIAHELRTPLMIASGYLHALNNGVLTKEQLATSMGTITRNVDQIVTLTNDILFLQEMDLVLPEFQPVGLVEVVNSVLDKYQAKADARQIRLIHSGGGHISKIRGDAKSLERAVTALVDNAIKFSRTGGEVEIRYVEQTHQVSLTVQDHGIGIEPAILPRIYDRFFHLEEHGDELYSGVGIGLSIARQVIHQHKGSLHVESIPEVGSTFTMTLMKWM